MIDYRPEGPPWDDGANMWCLMIIPGEPILLLAPAPGSDEERIRKEAVRTRRPDYQEGLVSGTASFRFDPQTGTVLDQQRDNGDRFSIVDDVFTYAGEERHLLGWSQLRWEQRIFPTRRGETASEWAPVAAKDGPVVFPRHWMDTYTPERFFTQSKTKKGIEVYEIYELVKAGPGKHTDEAGVVRGVDYARYELAEVTQNPPPWVVLEECRRRVESYTSPRRTWD
jgi:hypothetical protein